MFNNNLDKKIESIKKQTSYSILGAYLSGVAKDTAYIGKETTIKSLGESFCKFDENYEIDFSKRNLIDLSDVNTAPKSGGVISNLISQANNKIDDYALNLKAANLPIAESTKMLIDYANTLQKSSINIAFSEGLEDVDLKQDIRVLLKEGKEEFIKREQEEAQELENTKDDQVSEDEMGSEEGFEDINDEEFNEEDFNADEEFVDDDGNPIEEEEPIDDFAPEDDENMDDFEEEPEEGKGEGFNIQKAGGLMDYDELMSKGYSIKGRSINKMIEEKLRDNNKSGIEKFGTFVSDLFLGTNFRMGSTKTRGGFVDTRDGEITVKLDEIIEGGELDDVNNYLKQILFKNNEVQRNVSQGITAVITATTFAGGNIFYNLLKGMLAKPIGKFASVVLGLSMSDEAKLVNLAATILACDKIIEQYDHLIPQAEKRGDETRVKNWSKAKEYISKHKEKLLKKESKLKEKLRKKIQRTQAAEAFNLPFEATFDEEKFIKALEDRNLEVSYAEDYKYYHNGNIITTPPYKFEKMKKDLQKVERSSIKALGESVGMANVLESDEIQLKHKATVNELALIMVARSKYGFK